MPLDECDYCSESRTDDAGEPKDIWVTCEGCGHHACAEHADVNGWDEDDGDGNQWCDECRGDE